MPDGTACTTPDWKTCLLIDKTGKRLEGKHPLVDGLRATTTGSSHDYLFRCVNRCDQFLFHELGKTPNSDRLLLLSKQGDQLAVVASQADSEKEDILSQVTQEIHHQLDLFPYAAKEADQARVRYGIMDVLGRVRLPATFAALHVISSSVAVGKTCLSGKADCPGGTDGWRIMDISGKPLTPYGFDDFYVTEKNNIVMKGPFGVFHTGQKRWIPPVFDELAFGHDERVFAVSTCDVSAARAALAQPGVRHQVGKTCDLKNGRKWGAVDFQGREVVPFECDDMDASDEGFFSCSTSKPDGGATWRVFDSEGKVRFSVDAVFFDVIPAGRFRSKDRESVERFIDSHGNILFDTPKDFNVLYTPNPEVYIYNIKNEMTYGLLDRHGKVIQPPLFKSIYHLTDTILVANKSQSSMDDKILILDTGGNPLVPDMEDFQARCHRQNPLGFSNRMDHPRSSKPADQTDLLIIKKNGKFGVVSMTGQVLTPFSYSMIDCFHQGMAAFER